MSKLFLYYSLTGNGDKVADYLKKHGYDLRKIEVKNSLPKAFFLRMMVGGFKALIGKKEKLTNYNNDISDYDEVTIGSPIWNARLSNPVKTALEVTDLNDKKLTFVLYSGGGESPKATEYIKSNYPNATIINLKEPKSHSDEIKKLEEIIK